MLLRLAMITGAAAVFAVVVPQVAPHLVERVAAPPAESAMFEPAREVAAPPPPGPLRPAPRGTQLVVQADRNGHFHLTGTVNGRRLELMFDTGATSVAINEQTAHRLGIRPRPDAYRMRISTANGIIRAAPVRLPSLAVGRIRLRDVTAVVVPGNALPVNLLGMSFLGRLSHVEVAGDRLVMVR